MKQIPKDRQIIIITIAFFGGGSNQIGSSIDKAINMITAHNEEIKDTFSIFRKSIKKHWKFTLAENIPCTNEYRYFCSISIVNIDKNEVRFKSFTIDPKKIR